MSWLRASRTRWCQCGHTAAQHAGDDPSPCLLAVVFQCDADCQHFVEALNEGADAILSRTALP